MSHLPSLAVFFVLCTIAASSGAVFSPGPWYDTLAKHFVNMGNVYANDEEVIAFLRSRTAPIPFAADQVDEVAPLAA